MSASQQRLSASALARRREIARVWNVLHPKPVELRKGRRRFLREGPLKQWSPVQKRVKKKYVFLFSDCLLITRKDNAHRYWMKIFCYLKSIKDIQFVPGQAYAKVPDVEFRIVTPRKTLIFFGASKTETDTWIRDINYARNGCKGRAPPSVWQYGDEDNELDGQEDEIDITGHEAEGQISVGSPHQHQQYPPSHSAVAYPAHSAHPPQQQELPPQDLLVDFLGANAAINPFGGAQQPGAADPHGAGFDPFGLGGPVGQQSGQFDPNFLFGMGPGAGYPGQAGGAYPGQPGYPGSPGGYPGGAPGAAGYPGGAGGVDPSMAGFGGAVGGQAIGSSSPAARQPAPVFLPDAAQGAAQVASDLVRYLEQMPRDLQNPAIAQATVAAKEASARLQAAIQAFNANPNPETGRQLQQAAAEAALLVSQLMGEATFIAESQPPDDYKRQLAAAVHLTALSLEQLVNASSLALDHYTQQEHMRAIQYQQAQQAAAAAAAQAEIEARARAEAEHAAQIAAAAERARLEAEQAVAQKAMLDAAQAEQARIRLQALEAESARLAAQEAQIAQESLVSQREAAAALQNSMNSMQAAMESVALSITASAEKLAAAAAAAAAKAEAGDALPIAGAEIVHGTNSIAGLTAILVRVATEAQMEATRRLGASAIASGQRYHDDPVWREGLISAAQDVGTNIELLVGAAGQAIENNGPLEMLVASLRQVNGATARLVAAARAKMNPESELLPKLGRAAHAVKEASGALEQTASQAAKQRDAKVSAEQQPVPERSATATQGYIDRMEKLAEVARLEKQLEEARKRVAMVTKAQYDHM